MRQRNICLHHISASTEFRSVRLTLCKMNCFFKHQNHFSPEKTTIHNLSLFCRHFHGKYFFLAQPVQSFTDRTLHAMCTESTHLHPRLFYIISRGRPITQNRCIVEQIPNWILPRALIYLHIIKAKINGYLSQTCY